MPLTACPECQHIASINAEQLGHRTRCPNCNQAFRAERLPVSFDRIFRAGHPVGAAVGTLLLLAGMGVGGTIAATGNWEAGISFAMKMGLNAAAVCLVAGAILIIRHVRAIASRPQPIRGRPSAGPPGVHHGNKQV